MQASTARVAAALWLGATLVACGSGEGTAPPPDETSAGGSESTAEPAPAPESMSPEPAAGEAAAATSEDPELAPGDDTPATYACRLAANFNECIVERLEGRADTEAKMIQLIQSLRLLGRADDARAHMERFIETYPDSPQAQSYRDYLGSF